MQAVGVARLIVGLEGLKSGFDFIERGWIQQFAQVGVAEQFFQLRLVDGKRLGAALGQRGIAFVNVVRDVGKQQRGGKRRRLFGFDAGDANFAALNFAENAGQLPASRKRRGYIRDRFRE